MGVGFRMYFWPLGCSSSNFSKSVNSFGLTVSFHIFFRFFLSIRGTKSRNKFETTALTWVVETVLFRPSNSAQPVVGDTAVELVTGISGIFGTFWLPALNPDNRLRYMPVSLLRDMCWWSWLGCGAPENSYANDLWWPRSVVTIRNCKNHEFSRFGRFSLLFSGGSMVF